MLCYIIFFSLVINSFCDESDGGKAPRLVLNDGHAIPAIGLGTFLGFDENGQKQAKEREVELSITWALDAGYRLIDTAATYHNEDQIGVAVRNSVVPRENIYIVTKLGLNEQRNVIQSLNRSLERLNTSYVDLYLIHFPVAFKEDHKEFDIIDYLDTWKSMEEAKRLGLAKSIGISNFNISQIERILTHCQVKPAVLQVEVNLNLAQNKLIQFAKDNNITIMAYSPFGSLFSKSSSPPPPRVDDATLVNLGKKYNKAVPQIVLRYLTQRGVIPIPKSLHKDRIEQNIDIFDFTLTSEEMEILSKFNKDYRIVWPSFWQDHPYYPFELKDVPDSNIFEKGLKE